MKRVTLLLILAGCGGSHPWEAPWPREAQRLPSGQALIDLPTVLRLAGANSLDVAYVREKAHESYAGVLAANERFAPTVGPEGAFRRHDGSTQATDGQFVDVDKQSVFAGVRARLKWELGDAIFARLAAAQRYDSSLNALEAAEQSATLDAAVAYFDLLRDKLRVRIAEQAVQTSEKLAAQLKTLVELGRSFKGDLLRSRVQLASNRLSAARATESAKISAIRLASLLRLAPDLELIPSEDTIVPLNLVPTLDEATLLREALEKRPDVREATAELTAAKHEMAATTWGPLIPEIFLEAAPGRLGPSVGNLDDTKDYAALIGWRIGPGGLFDGARQHAAEARLGKAEINLERVRQRIRDQVRIAWAQIQSKMEQMHIAEQALRDAEEALQLNQQRQATNVGLPLEVIQAEEALTRVRLDSTISIAEYNQAQLRLLFAAGRPVR